MKDFRSDLPVNEGGTQMKKAYETPKAVKYVFDYTDNVVASNAKDGKTGHAANAC